MGDNQRLVEVWKNTAAGMRWCVTLDRQGKSAEIIVRGGRTFPITPFDRQMNQDRAESANSDLFRNGTFVLVKAADETDMDEITSADSLTDNELIALSMEILADPDNIDFILGQIRSPIALQRIGERLLVDDAPDSAVKYVNEKRKKFDKSVHAEVEHEVVSVPVEEKKVKTPRTVPDAPTEKKVTAKAEKGGASG